MGRFSKLALVGFFALIFFPPQPSSAHDGWVERSPTIIESGQVATIALIQGNHSNEHKSYRVAGKWDRQYTTLALVDPSGSPNDITDRITDFGEDDEKIGPEGPKGFFVASFIPKNDGRNQAVARQAMTIQQGEDPKLVTVRIAKATFAAFKVPILSNAMKLKGFDRPIAGEGAVEFIPVNNPLAVFSGRSMTFELCQKGQPLGSQVVTLVPRSDGFASAKEHTTDTKGRVTFVVGPADFYLARVKIDEESPRPDGQKDTMSCESTYVFQAFNRP